MAGKGELNPALPNKGRHQPADFSQLKTQLLGERLQENSIEVARLYEELGYASFNFRILRLRLHDSNEEPSYLRIQLYTPAEQSWTKFKSDLKHCESGLQLSLTVASMASAKSC